MMNFATCPRCMFAFAFDLPDDRTRVSCPNCLRTFDPFEPIPEKPEPVKESEATHGKADDLLPALHDEESAEPHDYDLTKADDDEADPETNEDFEQGL